MSPQAWALSRELVTGSFPRDVRFVGLNVLYKKALQDYGSLASADKRTLVGFLREVVQKLAAEQDGLLSAMAARAYAAVGILQVVAGEEAEIMNEILEQASSPNSEQSAFILLFSLNSIAEELEKIVIERKRLTMILMKLKSKKLEVASFLSSFMKLKVNSPHTMDTILSCINSWSQLKVQFLACPNFVEVLLQVYTQEEYYEVVNSLLICMLEFSSYARALESKKITEIIKTAIAAEHEIMKAKSENPSDFSMCEEESLTIYSVQLILNFLLDVVGPKFSEQLQKKRSEISKCFVELFLQLLKSFPVYLVLSNNQITKKVYNYAIMLLLHSDNSISAFSFDLWIYLNEIVNSHKNELDQGLLDFLTEVYDEVFVRLLERIKISNNKEFSILTQETGKKKNYDVDVDLDDEEDDLVKFNKFKNITLKDLRTGADDVFFGYSTLTLASFPSIR